MQILFCKKVKRANFMLIKISFLHPSCTPFIFSLDPTFQTIFPFSQLLLPSSFYPHNNNCFFHPRSTLTTTTASYILTNAFSDLILSSQQQLLLPFSQLLFPSSFQLHNCFFHFHSILTTDTSILIPSS